MTKALPCLGTVWPDAPAMGEVLCGRAKTLAESLLPRYRGQAQTVYLDPPFNTGKTFSLRLPANEAERRRGGGSLTVTAYDDRWPSEVAYISMMRETLALARELLREDGTLFLHVDPRMSAPLRLLLDEVFGRERFLNEIVWAYESGGRASRFFSRKHDTIFFYAKSKDYFFDLTAIPTGTMGERGNHMKRQVDADGRSYREIRSGGKVYRYYDDEPTYPTDVWTDIPHLQQRDPERLGFETQKPLALLSRILRCASREGDLVCDLFAGSGTTAEAAARLDRRFLAADAGALGVALTERRLLALREAKPFGFVTHAPCMTDGAKAVVLQESTAAGTALTLSAFDCAAARETGISGLNAVERLAAGYLSGDMFTACAVSTRTRKQPELEMTLPLPLGDGTPCLLVTDLWGNRRLFGAG